MEFFKGYIETKNKKSIERFKNKANLKSYTQVQPLSEFAGVLMPDVILIDIDDFEQSEILLKIVKDQKLKCRVYETSRGKHFLFKNTTIDTNKTNTKLAIGLDADIKLGKRNSYEVLKFDGKERKILHDIAEDEEAQDLPKWLIPIDSSMEFLGMKEGDGRNQALFNYILTLESNGFNIEESRECIKLINKYILKVPLAEDELRIVLRDEAFAKPVFFKGTTFLFDKFAIFLKNQHHIIRINNQLHMYKNGIYVSGYPEIEAAMIQHINNLNRAKRMEVLTYLEVMIRDNTPPSSVHLIAFRNGILNLKDRSLMPFSPDIIITNKIPWDYNPNAYSEIVDETLDKIACYDASIRALLEEAAGFCFFRRNELGKAFILVGTGNNGKSTYLNMVRYMLGKENVSSLDLKKLNDRFSTIMLFGKLANLGDDISDEFITDTSTFKKIVTGESIDAEQKGQPKFEFEPYVKLFFSANNVPRMGRGRDSASVLRRLVIIPFDAKFSPDDPDYNPYVGDMLRTQEAIEYMILISLKGLERVLKTKKFTVSEKVQKELEEYEESNNPILGFIKEIELDDEFKIENELTKNVYQKYQEYCVVSNLQPMSHVEFSRQINRILNMETIVKKIGKKTHRIFVSKG